MNDESRPKAAPVMCVDHDTTSVTSGALTWHVEAEIHLRIAGRLLETIGVTDPESARLAGAIHRFAQRVAVDSGRLERAA